MSLDQIGLKYEGQGIETVFPKYKGLDSETVVIKAGQNIKA